MATKASGAKEPRPNKGIVTRKNKDGTTCSYRREVWRDEHGKQKVRYHRLGDAAAPTYATKLARVERQLTVPVAERGEPAPGTVSALIRDFRRAMPKMQGRKKGGGPLADNTVKAWNYFLGQFEEEHGHKLIADIEGGHCYDMRDSMADTPGKANNYMAKLKGLLEFAVVRKRIRYNPARGVPLLTIGEFKPWPPEVVAHVKAEANPMLRLIIVSAYCSGQRISDLIRMRHDWHDGRFMRVPASKKTNTAATIPMVPEWLAEIEKVKALAEEQKVTAMTLLFDQTGKPFSCTGVPQNQLNWLMKKLGYVDAKGAPLYSFHGLSKNAICHFAEQGLTDETISAIVGKTPDTVRYYAKETRKEMLAEAAADIVISGTIFRAK